MIIEEKEREREREREKEGRKEIVIKNKGLNLFETQATRECKIRLLLVHVRSSGNMDI